MSEIKSIGVFTSGGDAPGMNAAIRAVVRSSIYHKRRVFGIYRGYEGMIRDQIEELDARSVNNIIHKGGTILKSGRGESFKDPEARKKAFENLKAKGIDGLVPIGGDGTLAGAKTFTDQFALPLICIPGTIDNDLHGTDYTIGYDTATNTAVQAIDKIRDTALSHNRLFFIEVMGRDCGAIAINSGIAGGAIVTLVPETQTTTDEIIGTIETASKNQKTSSLVVVAEAGNSGRTVEIANAVKQKLSKYETKVTIIGHLQRGGNPTYFDRVLASKLGVAAVEGLINGMSGAMVGIRNNKVAYTALGEVIGQKPEPDEYALRIAKILAI